MNAKTWLRGQSIPVRYVWREKVRYAEPAIVVEDKPERLILFTPMGSLTWRSRIDFDAGVVEEPEPHLWHSTDMLRFLEPGAGYAVTAMFEGGGPLRFWYIDLIEPIRRAGGGVVTWDLSLDIVATPDLQWQWKDEDHFARLQELNWITADKAADIRRETEKVIERIESNSSPFNEGWASWRPDPAWTMPVLPDDWAIVPATGTAV
jgi:hypothetical protein